MKFYGSKFLFGLPFNNKELSNPALVSFLLKERVIKMEFSNNDAAWCLTKDGEWKTVYEDTNTKEWKWAGNKRDNKAELVKP